MGFQLQISFVTSSHCSTFTGFWMYLCSILQPSSVCTRHSRYMISFCRVPVTGTHLVLGMWLQSWCFTISVFSRSTIEQYSVGVSTQRSPGGDIFFVWISTVWHISLSHPDFVCVVGPSWHFSVGGHFSQSPYASQLRGVHSSQSSKGVVQMLQVHRSSSLVITFGGPGTLVHSFW